MLKRVTKSSKQACCCSHVRGGRLRGFALQGEVHALVPSVLLRVPGLNSFDLDTESQPPHGELAQPVEGIRGRERDAVIGPNQLREAKLFEGAVEDGAGEFLLGR